MGITRPVKTMNDDENDKVPPGDPLSKAVSFTPLADRNQTLRKAALTGKASVFAQLVYVGNHHCVVCPDQNTLACQNRFGSVLEPKTPAAAPGS